MNLQARQLLAPGQAVLPWVSHQPRTLECYTVEAKLRDMQALANVEASNQISPKADPIIDRPNMTTISAALEIAERHQTVMKRNICGEVFRSLDQEM